jgi:hypothetical protein
MFNKIFLKSCRLWGSVEKHSRSGQAADRNMAHVHCMLARNTLRISNSYCVFTAAAVLRTCLYATLYLHCLSSYTYLCISYLFIHAEPGWLIYWLINWLILYFVFLLLRSFFALFTWLYITPLFTSISI